MKKGIHPEMQKVVFQDSATGAQFLMLSTAKPKDTVVGEDGNTYPVIKLDISSASHPFYTGKQRLGKVAGRVEKFNKKYGIESE